ncbi:unnamed protein product [Sphagnum jensenii]
MQLAGDNFYKLADCNHTEVCKPVNKRHRSYSNLVDILKKSREGTEPKARHGTLVNPVKNERALQDTLTFVGIRSACAGVMVLQWMFMNKPVKMACKSNVFVGQSGVALLTSDPKC